MISEGGHSSANPSVIKANGKLRKNHRNLTQFFYRETIFSKKICYDDK